MNARAFLHSAPVQKGCDAQRAEADKARWALESIQSDADKLGHFYLEVGGALRQDNPLGLCTTTNRGKTWQTF